jgi:peroxiredoxin Q/BCP
MATKLSGKATPEVGAKAPAFSLESDAGKTVKLSDLEGKTVVLYFYPRDSTPGCTREAHDFSAAAKKLAKLGAIVLGVSKDSIASHCKFRDKEGITFPLLSDTELEAHKAYGVWGDKMMYGKKITGTIRSTFVIGTGGKIAHVFSPVKVAGHVDAVLAAVGELASGG